MTINWITENSPEWEAAKTDLRAKTIAIMKELNCTPQQAVREMMDRYDAKRAARNQPNA